MLITPKMETNYIYVTLIIISISILVVSFRNGLWIYNRAQVFSFFFCSVCSRKTVYFAIKHHTHTHTANKTNPEIMRHIRHHLNMHLCYRLLSLYFGVRIRYQMKWPLKWHVSKLRDRVQCKRDERKNTYIWMQFNEYTP